MAGLPIDVGQLINAGNKLKEDRERPVRIAVLVEVDAPEELLEAVQTELRPKTAKGFVDVAVIEPGTILRVESSADAALLLLGSGSHEVIPTLEDLRSRAVPAVVIAVREAVGDLPQLLEYPERDIVVGEDAVELVRGPVADWVMDRLPEKRVAIAHNFAFVRRAVAKEAMRATAWQNALIGGVGILPGTDMPLMTLNQGKMLLQMAAAYGQDLGPERIWELGAVVGGGFVFRALARQALTLVPGFGWAIKAGVAYSGTIAMGEAAIAYFEQGASFPEMLDGLKEMADRSIAGAKGKLDERRRSRLGARGGVRPPVAHAGAQDVPETQLALPVADGETAGAGDD